VASDQGAVASVNRGLTWSSWYNQPTAQLYHIGVTPTFPYRVCSGQQESGSVCISSRGDYGAITFRDWRPVGAIEYGTVTPDPLDPDIIYGAGRSYVSKYRWSTAQTQNISPVALRDRAYRSVRTAPLVFSPLGLHMQALDVSSALVEHHPARTDGLEQGDPDRGLALGRPERLPGRESAARGRPEGLALPHPRRRADVAVHRRGPAARPGQLDPRGSGAARPALRRHGERVWVSFDDGDLWHPLQQNLPPAQARFTTTT
jgi:hypothetical protein